MGEGADGDGFHIIGYYKVPALHQCSGPGELEQRQTAPGRGAKLHPAIFAGFRCDGDHIVLDLGTDVYMLYCVLNLQEFRFLDDLLCNDSVGASILPPREDLPFGLG